MYLKKILCFKKKLNSKIGIVEKICVFFVYFFNKKKSNDIRYLKIPCLICLICVQKYTKKLRENKDLGPIKIYIYYININIYVMRRECFMYVCVHMCIYAISVKSNIMHLEPKHLISLNFFVYKKTYLKLFKRILSKHLISLDFCRTQIKHKISKMA